jgi:GT2 family glycosyltransferase
MSDPSAKPGLTLRDLIAVGVPTRNRVQLLERHALPGLAEIAAQGIEVLVVDQSDDDETRHAVERVSGVRYLRSPPGTSRARNAAVAATSTPFIAFVDDDVELPPGWLPSMVAALRSSERTGAVCGRALTDHGTLLAGRDAGVYRWPTSPFRLGSSFNIGLRRRALEEVGGFDPAFGGGTRFHSAEDTELLYRLLRGGWEVVCSDDVTIVHPVWRSRRELFALQHRYGLGIGAQLALHAGDPDPAARRIAIGEINGQLRRVASSLVRGRLRLATHRVLLLVGIGQGYIVKRRELGRRRG